MQLLPLGYYGETTSLMPTQAICSSTRSSSQTQDRHFGAFSIHQNITERPRHSKIASVDDITASAIFAKPEDKNTTGGVYRQPKKSKWERYTFSNLDKLAPMASYTFPIQPQIYEANLRLGTKTKVKQELFPKKSPIMQLLETNGTLSKAKALKLQFGDYSKTSNPIFASRNNRSKIWKSNTSKMTVNSIPSHLYQAANNKKGKRVINNKVNNLFNQDQLKEWSQPNSASSNQFISNHSV